MKKAGFVNGLFVAALGLSVVVSSCKKEGCTDPLAENYNKKANEDDGSCEYEIGVVKEDITEDITVPTTLSGGTYKVCADIEVSAALTIAPGTNLVMCAGASIDVSETGSMYAVGTAAEPIVIRGETEVAGFWEGLNINSNNPNNQFNYVTISDGGTYWAWNDALVNVTSTGRISIKNTTINRGEEQGLYIEEGANVTDFVNNTFSNNGLSGLNIHVKQLGALDAASSYNVGNGNNYISVRGGVVTTPQTWVATTTPYLFESTVDLGAAVTVDPGATLLFESGEGIDIRESGSLTAVGTAGNPINFKGRFTSAGYWAGIHVGSNNPNNKFTYCNITDGGSYWAWNYSGLDIEGRVELDNSTLSNSNSWGMFVRGSSTVICGGSTQTDEAGVTAYNTFTGNGAGPDADCVGGGCTVNFD